MPRVAEITSGVTYEFSGKEGATAASVKRVFRILKASTDEYVNLAEACGVSVGQPHPQEQNLFCDSYSAQYEGDSRLVIVATFNYQTTPWNDGGDGGGGGGGGGGIERVIAPPDLRPPKVTWSSSLTEVPSSWWEPVEHPTRSGEQPCTNPVGDFYEGVTRIVPVITATFEAFNAISGLMFAEHIGKVNENGFRYGGYAFEPRSVMFRGLQARPTTEQWGNAYFSGWSMSYEFAYRANWATYVGTNDAGAAVWVNKNIGWDIVVPQTGMNVKAHTPLNPPSQNNEFRDDFGQPLKHSDYKIASPATLPPGVVALPDENASKMRACVSFVDLESGERVQRPSSMPIPLNDNGTARSPLMPTYDLVKVYRYRIQKQLNFVETFPFFSEA